MELALELGIESGIESTPEIGCDGCRKISEFDVVPTVGVFLGLDISESSSGVTLYVNGNKEVYNISLESKRYDWASEVLLRRELAGYLLEIIGDRFIDVIVLEDVFEGVNPQTTRLLYALNTAIIELLVDGKCSCDKLVRVQNKVWKSWLFGLDTEGSFKGLNDKVRIQKCLELIGITESGEGFQDRLDSTGMLIGYFLEGYKGDYIKKNKNIGLSDLCFSHKADMDFISEDVRLERGEDEVFKEIVKLGSKKLSKNLFLDYIRNEPDKVFVFDKPIVLGAFGEKMGIDTNIEEGYLGFWLKKSKYKKLRKES